MNPPHELFPPERPVRSDFARADTSRERVYARRRVATVCVLLLAVAGGVYGIWGRGPRNPADIPTIKAEGPYRQKPADPGGIDIPHQDVQVYNAMGDGAAAPPPVEHLLPPPESPQPVSQPQPQPAPAPATAPVSAAPAVAPAASAPPVDILSAPAPKPVATTVTPQPAPKPAVPAPQARPMTIDDVLKQTETQAAKPPAAPAPAAAPASGNTFVQLASSGNEAAATALMHEFERRYAAQLDGATLHIVRADLGSRGIFYRIQSQSLSAGAANHICSALRQAKAGCFLVRK